MRRSIKRFVTALAAVCCLVSSVPVPQAQAAANASTTVSQRASAPVLAQRDASATGKPAMRWSSVPGAVKYEVRRASASSSNFNYQYVTTYLTFTNTSTTVGVSYKYKVRAIMSDGSYGPYSNTVTITCKDPQEGPALTPKANTDKPSMRWAQVPRAKKYEVSRAVAGTNNFTYRYNTPYLSFTNTGAAVGTTYDYRVRAIMPDGSYGAYSNVITITCAKGPALTPKPGTNKPSMQWTKVPGAVKYQVTRAIAGSDNYDYKYTTPYLSFTNTGAQPGTTYTYKVRAIMGSGTYCTYTAYSSPITLTCPKEAADHTHSFALVNSEDATCAKAGKSEYKCRYCDETLTYTTPALEHKEGPWVVVSEATAGSDGLKTKSCTLCGKVLKEETIHIHDYVLVSSTAATCTKAGKDEYQCRYCGEKDVETIPALGHKEGSWVVVKEATETSTGLKRKSCTVCKKVLKEEVIPKEEIVDLPYLIDLGNGKPGLVYGHFVDKYSDKAFDLLNQYRAKNGLNPLQKKDALEFGAEVRACELVAKFDHTRPNGTDCFTAAPGDAHGENIAYGYSTPESVMSGWKNSPGHNENMLWPSFHYVSVKCFAALTQDGNYVLFWVQLFGY